MQPPRARSRPGFSRRRLYGLFLGQVIAVAGIVVGLMLIAVARYDPLAFQAVRGTALDATAGISTGLRSATDGVSAIDATISDYFAAGSQNARLRTELSATRRALIQARADAYELARLKRIVALVEPDRQTVAVARLVSSTASSPRRMATLTAGRFNGVRPGQPVRSVDGLVGRVLETGQFAARVMLLTDEGNVVPVRVARGGAAALASGTGDAMLDVKSLGAGTPPFRRGDLLVSSGTGGLYPPDVPVAVVTHVGSDGASAAPLADPSQLDFAIVEPIYRTDLSAAPAVKVAR